MCSWHLHPNDPKPVDYDGCLPVVASRSSFPAAHAVAVAATAVFAWPTITITRSHPDVVPVFVAGLVAVGLVLVSVLVGLRRQARTERAATAVVLDKLGALLVTVAGEKGHAFTDAQIARLLDRVSVWTLPAVIDDAWLTTSVARLLNAEADRVGIAPTATATAVRALALGAP